MNPRWLTGQSIIPALLVLSGLVSCGQDNGHSITTTQTVQSGNKQPVQTIDPSRDIEALKSRLFDEPENVGLLSSLGDAYFESAQYEEAISIYDKAIMLDPNHADSMNDRGLSYFYLGNSGAALESVNQAITVAPSYIHAWLSKGFMLFKLGRNDEAVEAFNKVKELDLFGGLSREADSFLLQIEAAKSRG